MVQIIILLNSTDVVTGSAFETQASFTLANIKWDAMAKPCVFPDKIDNKVRATLRSALRAIDAISVGASADVKCGLCSLMIVCEHGWVCWLVRKCCLLLHSLAQATVDFKLFTETEDCPPIAEGACVRHFCART